MAKMKAGASGAVTGMVGSIVFVQRGETTYVRRAPQFKESSFTSRQKKNWERFGKINAFCQLQKFGVIIPIWNKVAEKKSGYHLFMKANAPAFGLDGELADQSLLHFSDGSLPSPFHYVVEAVAGEPGKLNVSWENDPMLSGQYMHDELLMMVAHDGEFSGPYPTGLLRQQQQGTIVLPQQSQPASGIYLFFGAPDREAFSPDRYLELNS